MLFSKILLRKLKLSWVEIHHDGQHVFPHKRRQTPPLTDKPAIVALFHHIHNVALSQLQLVFVTWQIVVHGTVPAIARQARLKRLLPNENCPENVNKKLKRQSTSGWREQRRLTGLLRLGGHPARVAVRRADRQSTCEKYKWNFFQGSLIALWLCHIYSDNNIMTQKEEKFFLFAYSILVH